jgi:3-isopropylmalate/(R)-2-methylmalate dehydratase small subunit
LGHPRHGRRLLRRDLLRQLLILGIPCLVASQADLEWLQKAIERAPKDPVSVDVERQEVRFGDRVIKATVPDGPRTQLVAGT